MILNFFPITINSTDYRLATETYSLERLIELRELYNNTHSFFRYNDKIYISNKDSSDAFPFTNYEDINAFSDEKITLSLIKHLFFRTFKDRFPTHIPVDFYPFRFFSKHGKDDIIRDQLPEELKDKIAYQKLIEVQIRTIKDNNIIRYGFVISIKRNWIFTKNCAELHAEGFNLLGLEVLRNDFLPGLRGILEPDDDFIGVIKDLQGDEASVSTNDGDISIPLTSLSIRKTNYNLGAYLSFKLGQIVWLRIKDSIKSKRHEVLNNKTNYEDIKKIASSLFLEKDSRGDTLFVQFRNKGEFYFTVEPSMLQVQNSMNLKAPEFIFDHAATQVHKTADFGLNSFGPYDATIFEPKSPLILCIGHRDTRGHFSSFLANLINGMPQSIWYKIGLKKKYELQNVQLDIHDINEYTGDAYLQVIKTLEDKKPDLAIIEIPTSYKELRNEENPYFIIKAKLLKLEIPVQFVTTPIIRASLDAILNSIGLQLYAKLGGIPWVLPANQNIDREIVIGIGNSWIRGNAFKGASQDRVVGITTFLSSDGQYLLSDKAKDVPYEAYFQELLNSLSASIDKLEKEQGWQENDTIRLIFHIFKPIKNVEFEVVAQLINSYRRYNIRFAFVTISKFHPFRLYDSSQPGIQTYNKLKGEFVPNRSSNFKLDNLTAIVQMYGAKEMKSAAHGVSNPVLIRIRSKESRLEDMEIESLLFTDLDYIVQQIFSFTYLSWRSFLATEEPATMLYAKLISKLLGRLRSVQGWDPDSLNFKLKKRKWFL